MTLATRLSVGFLWAACAASATPAWTIYETAQASGHRLADVSDVPVAVTGLPVAIVCDPGTTYQTIEGFGGALTESSAWVLDQLPADKKAEVVRRYYDPKEGIGYTLARTHINSCDFSLGIWALDPVAGDTDLKHFSLDPMRRWVLHLIHSAQDAAGRPFRLLASPWSPPSWMKTNGAMTFGGSLKPEYRQAWADYFVRFIEAMQREEHIPVWALTVQNEPAATQTWESCLYTAAEERDFIRDHLGPTLAKAKLGDVKVCILDHNRDLMDTWTHTIYGDAAAARFTWGTAMHWYVSEDFAAASRAHAAFPDKATLFTEGCNDRGEEKTGPWVLGRWDHGERYAHNMLNDFKNWVVGWIDWNIVLDQTGGPNHVGNFCDAPVIVNTETGEVTYQSSYYYIAQFSRFVRPGAQRIESHGGPLELESVAFRNPDGSLAVVVLNQSARPVPFTVTVAGENRPARIPAHSIQTFVRRF